jgi:uncharacterized protein (DUF2126 family)
MESNEFVQIVQIQDNLIRAKNVEVWIGMEPTFTQRFSESPEWLSEALGPKKLGYGYQLLREAHSQQPGGVVLHTLGRQYASEDLPRWNIGYYQSRTNQLFWDGPPDPGLLSTANTVEPATSKNVEQFWHALQTELKQNTWQISPFKVHDALDHRILFRVDDTPANADINRKSLLSRASVHEREIPLTGLIDQLAAEGDMLVSLGLHTTNSAHHDGISVVIELPEMPSVKLFEQLLLCISKAANLAALDTLVIQGFPPPVDASVAWTTITPDPAVIEINQAPAENSVDFYQCCDLYFRAAQTAGLEPYRLHYNGVVSDSGGGGQFTLGGPAPLASPFFCHPYLLPRLIRYINAHPVLSYWFAPPSIGSSSQSPRTDEGVRESFLELSLALEQVTSNEQPDPEFIWQSISPFLVDPSGNPHRSELNIEKLWNPYLPGRGCLGLVEFRAFRMSRTPQCATAISVLLRSLVAMLSHQDKVTQLIDHGSQLHDRYALPFYLQEDFQAVFNDLQEAGLPQHDALKSLLLEEPVRFIGQLVFHGCCIELHHALEFWPLVGDVASQEGGGSRLIDASTVRIQITLKLEAQYSESLDHWEVWLDGYQIPLRHEDTLQGPLKITGLRYRNFQPTIGLHPGIAARDSLTLILINRSLPEALEITYKEWQPEGLAYPGLPENLVDAHQRRLERFITKVISIQDYEKPKTLPESALSDYCVDLRRLSVTSGSTTH